MAPSAAAGASSSYTGRWEYDVFLCFRGGDVRDNFMSHLKQALLDKQIRIFVDTMLPVTEDIDELLAVLRRTAISVVIFSENFADSPWCLDEVATVAQIAKEFGHKTLPVFYNVDWTAVAGTGADACYATTMAGLTHNQQDIDKWRNALTTVASKTGRTTEAIPVEAELVKEVVGNVITTLVAMSSSIQFNNLVGMDSRVLEVEQRLAMSELDTVRIVGLQGMGGLGKTTLARTCYEKLRFFGEDGTKFHFVDRVGENGQNDRHRVEGLTLELYSALLSEDSLSGGDLNVEYRRARLSRLRVLVVLDDVQTPWQLEDLLLQEALNPTKLFAAGSRIIVTTRNRRVLEYAKAEIHVVGHLNVDESLHLFKLHAFLPGSPVDGDGRNDDLSHQVISYCKGNPLALRVLGGTLLHKDKKYWESFCLKLSQIQEPEIHHILRRSYDELGDDDKRLFLDIACLFFGCFRSLLVKYMENVYTSAYTRVGDLIDRSLLISVFHQHQQEIVVVHDLLREMAWNIVNEEENIGKRSRLNNPDDIHNLLTIWKGDRATQAIRLDLSKSETMRLEANAFEGMGSLRWLDFVIPKGNISGRRKIVLSEGILNSLPNELRGLCWDGFPAISLPSGFSPKKLAYLFISRSRIQRCWERAQPKLDCLILLSLTYCPNLTVVPNLWNSSNLEHLVLQKCKILVEVPASIQSLVKLVRFEVRDCQNMQSVPARLNSKFLRQLILANCPKVTHCPEVDSGELEILDLDGTPINALPDAIYKVKQGGVVCLYGPNITSFPQLSMGLDLLRLRKTTIGEIEFNRHQGANLPKFERLQLIDNSQLKTLPRSIWSMVSDELVVDGSPLIECLPEISQPVGDLTRLIIVDCGSLKSLPSGIGYLKSLQVLACSDTAIEYLSPSFIQGLDQLSRLDLSYNTILAFVPSNIHELTKLSSLLLMGCWRIQYLPELPPSLDSMDVSGCKSLRLLPSNARRLRWKFLRFVDCPKLKMDLPTEMVEQFPHHALLSLHSQGMLQYSGSEIPKFFRYKNLKNGKNGSFVTVQLPPPRSSSDQLLVKGIALGVVCSSDSMVSLFVKCDCSIGTATIASWSCPDLLLGGTSSDVVHMWFNKNLFGESQEGIRGEGGEPWYVKYAGLDVRFKIRFEPKGVEDHKNLKNVKCKSVGVSLLF